MYKILHIPTGFYLGVLKNQYTLVSEPRERPLLKYQSSFKSNVICERHLNLVFNYLKHTNCREPKLTSPEGWVPYIKSNFIIIEIPC